MMKCPKSYAGVFEIFKLYWKAYGGAKALLFSFYLHFSLLITVLLYPVWTKNEWWDDPLAIMPNVLGFSLGGYAIWLALGDEKFRFIMAGSSGDETSPFMALNASFVHFILLQILSIVFALLGKAYIGEILPVNGEGTVFSFIGYFLFVYALLSALAATMYIFRVSRWYEEFSNRIK